MNIELKPCPFCACEEIEIERLGNRRQSMIIACTECGCRVESGDQAEDTLVKHYRWNKRYLYEDKEIGENK